MAEGMDAEYVELANTQYYGWAWQNRDQLLPSREQVQRAEEIDPALSRIEPDERMKIYFVVPDYFERRPKPCMNGLGSVFLNVVPDGIALPATRRACFRACSSRTCVRRASSRSGSTHPASITFAVMRG